MVGIAVVLLFVLATLGMAFSCDADRKGNGKQTDIAALDLTKKPPSLKQ